ncbi:MAG: lipid A biosynthesis lauroyl acyltransferase, partial [Gammaproteobacteria bacterium]|nr:lipid A biosynthesis lauroyl acyltransferase [Gammaproteobacteria bacterium]
MSNTSGLQLTRWLHPKYWGMWLFFIFLRLVILLPLKWIDAIGAFLGWLLYRLAPSRRRVTRINIQQAYPEYKDDDIKKLIKASYKSLGVSVFEMALAWWASRDYLRKHCHVEGMEHLEQALANGKGAIMLTGHFSTLEIGGILLALFTPLNAVYKKAHNPMFNTFMHFYRSKHLQAAIPNTNVRGFIKGL